MAVNDMKIAAEFGLLFRKVIEPVTALRHNGEYVEMLLLPLLK